MSSFLQFPLHFDSSSASARGKRTTEPVGECEVEPEPADHFCNLVGVKKDSVRRIEDCSKRRMKIRWPLPTETSSEVRCLAGLSSRARPPEGQKLRELFDRANRGSRGRPIATRIAHAAQQPLKARRLHLADTAGIGSLDHA